MKFPQTRFLSIFLSLMIGGSWNATSALESDSTSPVDYTHDGNLNMGISGNIRTLEMFDNVRVTQGSMVIQGDEAIFEYRVDTNELIRVTVHGSPAQYEQQINDEGDIVTGNSDTIVLFTDEIGDTIIELTGNASIESADSTTRCEAITYLSDQNLIRSAGPCSGTFSQQDN